MAPAAPAARAEAEAEAAGGAAARTDEGLRAAPPPPPPPPRPLEHLRGERPRVAPQRGGKPPSSGGGMPVAGDKEAGAAFRERAVPSSRVGRVLGFGQMAASLLAGTVAERVEATVSGALGGADKESAPRPRISRRNAEVFAEGLCRMRGAALKLGQMLSIQDEGLLPPELQEALQRVRQGADAMPRSQLQGVLEGDLGPKWEETLEEFSPAPIAAASIGQVHSARVEGRPVAVKVQYPGVADSLVSDIDNLATLAKVSGVLPDQLFLDNALAVAKKELALECDYTYEAGAQARFRRLLEAEGSRDYYVPDVFPEASGPRVLTTEFVAGVPIDRVETMSQDHRDRVGTLVFGLAVREVFEWRYMQTDPNWSNFLYDPEKDVLNLIDFGAAKEFPKPFVDEYLRMVQACARGDRDEVVRASRSLGFLTGDETPVMLDAHCEAGIAVGRPFATEGGFDFGAGTAVTKRVAGLGGTMLEHRLTPPPDEAYALHRKLAGAFLACIKLRAVVDCKSILDEVAARYRFEPAAGGAEEPEAA